MGKREGELKSQFTKELYRQVPDFLSLSLASRGAPDRSITGAGRTTFWEFKHATPDFTAPGLQVLTCMRLDKANFCRFVLWWEGPTGLGKRTMIVTPRAVHERKGSLVMPEEVAPGFDHKWLVEYIREIHKR